MGTHTGRYVCCSDTRGPADFDVISAKDCQYNSEGCNDPQCRKSASKRRQMGARPQWLSHNMISRLAASGCDSSKLSHWDQAWLSAVSVYTQQPYSAPKCFNIDMMIEIAETKAMEAGDELWLLQTDLGYFHDLMKRHEREWLDSVPRMEELKKFSHKDKMDNIGYIMTMEMVIQMAPGRMSDNQKDG